MKTKILLLLGMSLMLTVGTAACVSLVSAECPIQTKAESYTNATTTRSQTVWLNYNSYSWIDPYISYHTSSGWTHKQQMTNDGTNIAKYELPVGVDQVIFSHTSDWHGDDCKTPDTNIQYGDYGDAGCVYNLFTLNNRGTNLYGAWTYKTGMSYTIKYNANGGTGSVSDQQVWLDNATVDDGESLSKENYELDSWNTSEDGSGTKVLLGSSNTYKNALSMTDGDEVTLYAQWVDIFDERDVKVSVAGGSYTAMTWSETNKQFELENLSLASGSSIEFKVDGVDISYTEGYSTNLRNHKVVRPGESLGIYIRYANGVYTVYVSGSDYETYSREVVINDVYMLATEKVTVSPDPYEYYVKDVSLNVGDTIKGSYKYGAAYNLDIEAYGAHENFEKDGSVLKCKTAGVYDIYLKSHDSGSNYNYVYIGFSDATRAISWATSFNTQVGGVCNRTTGQTDLDDLKAAWAAVKASYDADESIHRFFDGTESSSNPQIVQCLADYDYIVVKYAGETGLEGFISRTPVATPVIHNNFVDLPVESSIAIVAVIAVVAVTSIGAFFVIRKRKEN